METATLGSECAAASTAVDQIIDLRTTLMYLGPVNPKSYMFGDDKAVVDYASIPTSVLSKRSHLAAYHQVWEVIAAGYLFTWKEGKSNPADILSQHWVQRFGHCSNLYLFRMELLFGMEILLNLAPNQRGVA